MIDTEILDDYSSEARELLDEMDHSLIRLEKEGGLPEVLNNIFRAVHCIKGSAQYIGLESSSTLTHGVENLLDRLREGLLELDSRMIEFLFRAKDLIAALIEEVAKHREEKSDISGMMEELDQILQKSGALGPGAATEPSEETREEEAQQAEAGAQPQDALPEESDIYDTDVSAGTEELEAYAETLEEESAAFDEESMDQEDDALYDSIPYVVREYEDMEEEELSDALPASFEDVSEEAEGGIPGDTLGTAAEEEPQEERAEAPPVPDSDEILGNTVPHLLSLSLYLDDFEDGLVRPGEIVPHALSLIENVMISLSEIQMPEAVQILETLQDRLHSLDPDRDQLSAEEINELRSLLYELRTYYPPDLFPLAEPKAPERGEERVGEPAEELETGEEAPEAMAAVAEEKVPDAAQAAPPESPKEMTGAPTTGPRDESLLADVDDDLLREFEFAYAGSSTPQTPAAQATPVAASSDLIEGLDLLSEDTDREIIEIFMGYGFEIVEKIQLLVDTMLKGRVESEDLHQCAEHIKSIRSSSTYMDYQKLAAFLDEWYEDTLAAAGRTDSLTPHDLDFMTSSLGRFQGFLADLQSALSPEAVQPEVAAAAGLRTSRTAPPPDDERISRRHAPEPLAATGTQPAAGETTPLARVSERPAVPPVPAAAVGEEVKRAAAAPREIQRVVPGEPAGYQDMFAGREGAEGAVVKTMRVDSAKVDTLLNQVGELVVNRSYVEQLSIELKSFHRTLMALREVGKKEIQSIKDLALKVGEASIALGRVATDIQEGVMKLRMLPVGQLFNRMPRLIRDLSRRVGKTVNLEVHGADTEVDKRVIEQIYNPLVHLIRNAVDHGVEDPQTRKKLGKSEQGLIVLRAYSQGNLVSIDVEDDGSGINTEAVLARAVEGRLIEAQEASNLGPQDVFSFLFIPGFSTSPHVTRTSGRGVGMDVVKKDVEKINGHVDIESWENEGTRISIKIPLTLAIIQTLLIRSAEHVFAIPLTSVREIIQVSSQEITTIEGFEVIKFRDETIPILRINDVFNLRQLDPTKVARFLVLATAGTRSVGFLVEELIGEQDVVIKPLAEHVFKGRGLAGSTILGDGTIALVMDIMELVDDIIAQQRQVSVQAGTRYLPVTPSSEALERTLDV